MESTYAHKVSQRGNSTNTLQPHTCPHDSPNPKKLKDPLQYAGLLLGRPVS